MSEHTPGRRVSEAEFEAALDQMATSAFFDDWLAFVELIRADRAAILALNADLLAALEGLVQYWWGDRNPTTNPLDTKSVQTARAAIAKAKGES